MRQSGAETPSRGAEVSISTVEVDERGRRTDAERTLEGGSAALWLADMTDEESVPAKRVGHRSQRLSKLWMGDLGQRTRSLPYSQSGYVGGAVLGDDDTDVMTWC